MPKHPWRNSLKSFIRSYIDPEKDEELKGAKAEIDDKVHKILKFLKEDQDDTKEQFADLMEEFCKYHQSLYARYDNLTEELRKKSQSKLGNDSSSSSSDSSDLDDDSPREKGQKNGKVQETFENTVLVKQELEVALAEAADLKRKLAAAVDEKEALNLEHQSALTKAREAQTILMDLDAECKKYNDSNSKLSTENAELIQKLEETNQYIDELRAINGQLQQEIDALQQELQDEKESLLSKVKDLELELSSTIYLKTELEEQVKSKNQEISECLIQIESLKHELEIKVALQQKIEEEKESLRNKISDYERTLVERGDEISAIQNNMEDAQNEASGQISALEDQVNSLQQQLELLRSEKSQTEVQIERAKQESEGSLAEAEKLLTELTYKIVEQERELKEKDDKFMKLSEVHKNLEVELQKCVASLNSSQKKIEEMTEQFQKDIDIKNQEVEQLEEQVEDLKRELDIKLDEMSTLVENMRTTEVKQRLIGQKLRITEQVLSENEEAHQKRVEKLEEEKRLLEERITTLSGIIVVYKEAQVKMVTEISDKVNNAMTGFDTFSVKFEEDYGHLESRIYEILNELKVARNWITGNNAEKDHLKKEVASLLQQLKDEKEQVALLKLKMGELQTLSLKNEDERKSLIQKMKEKMEEVEKMIEDRDAKLEELGRKLADKDVGILNLGEEKREAIRQLCIWIDYHHNRYDDLKDLVLKKRGGRIR